MRSMEDSQCLTKPPEGTVAELRHPSAGKKGPSCPERNPLLWRLGAYRRVGRFAYSRLVLKFGLFGFGLASLAVILAIVLPQFFSAHDFSFLSSMLVSAHVFWLSASMWRRLAAWRSSSFLDELLLTNLTASEIATGLAHATARPIGASFLGALLPIYVYQAICGYCGLTDDSIVGHPILVWPFLGPFVLLGLFSIPWISMSMAWNPCVVRHWPAALLVGWIAVPPWLALDRGGFVPFAIGGFALFCIQLGVLNSKRAAAFLIQRE
ncbi:hypothetical protein KQI84_06665 [bacterium]|nr:hypothetical protein [bacterium]